MKVNRPTTEPLLPLLDGILLEPAKNQTLCHACKGGVATSVQTHAVDRHWLLDHFIGRTVLLAQLRLSDPVHAPAWSVLRAPGLDDMLEPLIDVLGMRSSPQPRTDVEDLQAATRLLGTYFRLQCQFVWYSWTQLCKRPAR